MALSEDHPRLVKKLYGPVGGLVPSEQTGTSALLEAFRSMSFQARTLGQAAEILTAMCSEPGVYRVLTLAGALVPGGLQKTLVDMVRHGLVDVIISTGANISHDFIEGMGYHHYRCCNLKTDEELREAFVDRIYDTYVEDDAFYLAGCALKERLGEVAGRRTSTELTRFAGGMTKSPCLLSIAREHDVPIYLPALNDSEFGIIINTYNKDAPADRQVIWDGLQDNIEFAERMRPVERWGIVICGGGVPRNWAQQVTPLLEYLYLEPGTYVRKFPGCMYGVHITTDTPVYGGLSGCTFSESISWGKYNPGSRTVTVNCDVTIALPLIVSAALERLRGRGD